MAAKAAAIEGTYVRVHQAYGDQWVEGIDTGAPVFWNPLTDDGDALRLAVKLGMDVCFGANYVVVRGAVQSPIVNNANDPYAATRYAITRAAAEIERARITTEDGK